MRPAPRSFAPRPRRRLPRSLAAAGLLALGATGVTALSQPVAEEARSRAAEVEFSVADRELCTAIRQAHRQIIHRAESALKFTPTPDVLVLAHQVLGAHRRLSADLDALAPAEAAPVEPVPPLEGNVNEEFDRVFLGGLVEETQRTLAILAAGAQGADAPVLRAYATDALVVLDRNLRQARELQRSAD